MIIRCIFIIALMCCNSSCTFWQEAFSHNIIIRDDGRKAYYSLTKEQQKYVDRLRADGWDVDLRKNIATKQTYVGLNSPKRLISPLFPGLKRY